MANTVTSFQAMPIPEDLATRLLEVGRAQRFIDDNRDELILEAVETGGSLREIAELVGISHTGVRKIVQRGRPRGDTPAVT